MNYLRHWIVPAALLLVSAGFFSLGRWQLDRAEVNRNVERIFVQADALEVLDLPVSNISVESHRYRHLRLTGHYEPTVQVLLDNMTRAGRAGYEVLTPFVIDDASEGPSAGPRVLVNRGWVPAPWDRSELPAVSIAPSLATIEGRIDRLPRAALDLGQPAASDGRSVVVLSFPGHDDIETVLGRPVHRFQLLLADDQMHGYTRTWAPETDRDERNVAYAVQWFALAALALAIGIGVAINGYRKTRVSA
jgi:surfeit locus 1 family protein